MRMFLSRSIAVGLSTVIRSNIEGGRLPEVLLMSRIAWRGMPLIAMKA